MSYTVAEFLKDIGPQPYRARKKGASLSKFTRKRRWPERRGKQRVEAFINVTVSVGFDTFTAIVRDISSDGVGLIHEGYLSVDDLVTISIDGLSDLSGVVVWSVEDRAGVRFSPTRS